MLSSRSASFGLNQVMFLGHVISKDGVSVDPAKVEAVMHWRQPKSVSDIRSFSRVCRLLSSFLSRISRKIASPMDEATSQRKLSFVWTQQCEESFQELKKRLTTTPILTLPFGQGRLCDL